MNYAPTTTTLARMVWIISNNMLTADDMRRIDEAHQDAAAVQQAQDFLDNCDIPF